MCADNESRVHHHRASIAVTIVNEAGDEEKQSLVVHRDDFWASTSNKQLNFLQHVFTVVKQHGRAAIVVPDNVLFEGGAGETVRRELLKQADVHTLLRLPTGIFYALGVKANVLFFDRKPAAEKPWTEKLWIYDLRTNKHFTLKENTLKRTELDDFVNCYFGKNSDKSRAGRHERKESERFKSFTYEDLLKRDKLNLDIFWRKDESLEDSANLPDPDIIAAEIVEDLEAALSQFATMASDLHRNCLVLVPVHPSISIRLKAISNSRSVSHADCNPCSRLIWRAKFAKIAASETEGKKFTNRPRIPRANRIGR